jgi:hypothetical protein
VSIRHQFLRSSELDAALRELASASFKNESFGSNKSANLTAPLHRSSSRTRPCPCAPCMCVPRKFAGLYDFALLTASTDEP